MHRRAAIPAKTRIIILLRNRHSCCVCGRSDVQIHHINADNSDNHEENLAVLCLTVEVVAGRRIRQLESGWRRRCAQTQWEPPLSLSSQDKYEASRMHPVLDGGAPLAYRCLPLNRHNQLAACWER
jgi:hypothetical protein